MACCDVASVPYEENNDAPAFFASKHDLDQWPFNQMPVLQLQDGTRLAQQASQQPHRN